MAPGGTEVGAAVEEMQRVLGPHAGLDWGVAAGTLEWPCSKTAAHVAHVLFKYAGQLAVQPRDAYLPVDLVTRPVATPGAVLSIVAASGTLLSLALDAADESTRAWHWGLSDASGFAAMGIGEVLVHTFDIAEGLDIPWRPPDEMARPVVARLLPGAPSGDAGDVLLWATGRAALAGRPAATAWVWKAAP